MFDEWREKRKQAKREKQLKKCAKGDHDWVLMSSDTMLYDYDSAGGVPPSFTIREYVCYCCGETRTEKEGDEYSYRIAVGEEQP